MSRTITFSKSSSYEQQVKNYGNIFKTICYNYYFDWMSNFMYLFQSAALKYKKENLKYFHGENVSFSRFYMHTTYDVSFFDYFNAIIPVQCTYFINSFVEMLKTLQKDTYLVFKNLVSQLKNDLKTSTLLSFFSCRTSFFYYKYFTQITPSVRVNIQLKRI